MPTVKKGWATCSAKINRMITTYIFDLDDTLIPSDGRTARAYGFLAEAGADKAKQSEAGRRLWQEVAGGRLSMEEKLRREALAGGVSDEVAERFVAMMHEFEPAYEDALPLLERLVSEGRRLAIISNGPPGDHQRAKLRTAGLDRFFGDFVFISCEVGVEKPDPRIFQHALRVLGVRPEEAVYVGDKAEHDAGAAVAAGLHGVWVDRRGIVAPVPPGVRRITSLSEL